MANLAEPRSLRIRQPQASLQLRLRNPVSATRYSFRNRLAASRDVNVHAVSVARGGKLVFERYFTGSDEVHGRLVENIVFDAGAHPRRCECGAGVLRNDRCSRLRVGAYWWQCRRSSGAPSAECDTLGIPSALFILANSVVGLFGAMCVGQNPTAQTWIYALASLAGAIIGTSVGLRWITQSMTSPWP
jgi:hypothetical protein